MSRRTAAASGALALTAALMLAGCTADEVDTSTPDLQPVPDGRLIDPASGTATLAFDPGFLDAVGGGVEPQGDATGTGRTVRMPIVYGQLSVSATDLTGSLALNGSQASFTGGDTDLRMSDLVLDLQAGTVAGSLSADGEPIARHALLFELDLTSAKRSASDAAADVRLTGARLLLTSRTADLIDEALGQDRLAPRATAAALSLAVDG